MFINKDMVLSILQMTEIQWETYKKFLALTNDEKEASRQTKIFMGAMFASSQNKEEEQ